MDSSLMGTLTEHLIARHKSELLDIITNPDCNRFYSIFVDFISLLEENVAIGNGILIDPATYLTALDSAAISAQKHVLEESKESFSQMNVAFMIKGKICVRIKGLPFFGDSSFPCNNDIGLLVKIRGTLIKAGIPKLLEYQRDYSCLKCNHVITVKAIYEKYYTISSPLKCQKCHGTQLQPKREVDVSNFVDYQEIKVQEHFCTSKARAVPRSIVVTLEGDLVDSCKPGDDVIVIGVLMRRWKPLKPGFRYDINLVIKANNIELCNKHKASVSNKEAKENFSLFWQHYKDQELNGRNHILESFCPQTFGLYLAKLAMIVVLAGGVEKADDNGSSARGMSHLLLVGDAGTGKSHLLRYASRVFSNSVFTTGVGSTTAGLTVTAVREGGDWNLEAGALVLADGGLCCIDDFNSIREHDRTSIHEAMEQQSISVAKAGIVTKLHTRCSVFATTSTKGKYDPTMPMSVNVALSSPLLSRFDIVFVLIDSKSPTWDRSLCNFVFKKRNNEKEIQETFSNKAETLIKLPWSTDDIQNYFAIIKDLNPVMTAEAGLVLRSYYQFQRMTDGRNAARTTVRLLESLIRLSQGHAKLMYREKVTILDAITAITLIESSMLNSNVNSEVNALHTLIPENPYEEFETQAKSILTKLKLEKILRKEMEKINGKKSFLSGETEKFSILENGGNEKYSQIKVGKETLQEVICSQFAKDAIHCKVEEKNNLLPIQTSGTFGGKDYIQQEIPPFLEIRPTQSNRLENSFSNGEINRNNKRKNDLSDSGGKSKCQKSNAGVSEGSEEGSAFASDLSSRDKPIKKLEKIFGSTNEDDWNDLDL